MTNYFPQNVLYIKQPKLASQLSSITGEGKLREKELEVSDSIIFLMLGADRTAFPQHMQHLVIVEPNLWQLKYFLENVKLPPCDILVITNTNIDEMGKVFYQYLRAEQRLSVFETTTYAMRGDANEGDKQFFTAVLRQFEMSGKQAITTFSGSPIHFAHGLRHFCNNATKEHIDYRCFKEKYTNVPACIVSGGPSAEKDIPELRRFKGVISCVDTAYLGLQREGIQVDFVASMDREPKLIDYYETVQPDTRLVAIPEVSDKIISKFEPNVILLPTLRKFYVKGLGWEEAYNGGTATTHLIFTFLRYIGCSPIILVGQDFGVAEEEMPFNCDGSLR